MRAASVILSIVIMAIVAGPIVGTVSPQLMTQQQPLGLGLDLNSINSQLDFFQSRSAIAGPHDIVIPAFNNWPIPGTVSLSLAILMNGTTVYETQPASVDLPPFQSGQLHVTMDVPSNVVSQLRGKIGIGGTMSLSEDQFWTITVTFPQ